MKTWRSGSALLVLSLTVSVMNVACGDDDDETGTTQAGGSSGEAGTTSGGSSGSAGSSSGAGGKAAGGAAGKGGTPTGGASGQAGSQNGSGGSGSGQAGGSAAGEGGQGGSESGAGGEAGTSGHAGTGGSQAGQAGAGGSQAGQAGTSGQGDAPLKAEQVVTGAGHSCARLVDGRVKCWGSGAYGQLGLGDSTAHGDKPGTMGDTLPTIDLGAGATVASLTAGMARTCALLVDKRVKCWGENTAGQLGLGDSTHRGNMPGQMGDALPAVDLGTNLVVTAIHAGETHTCVVFSSGQLKCWGDYLAGALGLEDTQSMNSRGDQPGEMGDALPFVNLGTNAKVASVAAGQHTTCAVFTDGRVKCWGSNLYGQLGLGDTMDRGDKPGTMGDALPFVDLGLGMKAASVVIGQLHVCALLTHGRVKCWGENSDGRLGLGDTTSRGKLPGQMGDALPSVNLGTGARAISLMAGTSHTCALLDDGSVKCWGRSESGQLGLEDTSRRGDKPSTMSDSLPVTPLGSGVTVASFGTKSNHSCAVTNDGRVKCWGSNPAGSLGLGDESQRGDKPGQMGDALPFVDLGMSP